MKTKLIFRLLPWLFILMACGNDTDEPDLQPPGPSFPYEETIAALLEAMNMPRPADSYNYPAYPGMQEWIDLKTVENRVKACQVPIETLKEMSTQAVIQAIWEYPFLIGVTHRSQYQMDFEANFLDNNAFIELTQRSDAGKALLERMVLVNPLVNDAKDASHSLEILTSQPVFLSQLTDDEKKLLVRTAFEKDALRQANFELSKRGTTWLLMAKTMKAAGFIPFIEEMEANEELQNFVELRTYYYGYSEDHYDELPQLVVRYAESYINENEKI